MLRRSTMTSWRSKAFSTRNSDRIRARSPAAATISLAPDPAGRSRRCNILVRMTIRAVAAFKFRGLCEWPTTTKPDGSRSGWYSSRPRRALAERSRQATVHPGNPLISHVDAKGSQDGTYRRFVRRQPCPSRFLRSTRPCTAVAPPVSLRAHRRSNRRN